MHLPCYAAPELLAFHLSLMAVRLMNRIPPVLSLVSWPAGVLIRLY